MMHKIIHDWLAHPDFHLLRPWWLLALVPALLLGWLLHRRGHATSGWASVIDSELLADLLDGEQLATPRWPLALLLAGWVLACIALSGPSFSKHEQAALKQADALVILLDLSPSMLTQDVHPSRLQAAHYKILDLLRERREGYTALIAYSGSAHVVAPLSDDSNTIAALVTTLEPRIMPSLGSQTEDAVSEALQLLANSHFTRGRILLLTDGVVPAAIDNIHKQLRDKPVELHVIGIGTAEGGPIKLNSGEFIKDQNGQVLINKLDEAPLQQLAQENGGSYNTLRADDADIAALAAPPAWLTELGNGEQRDSSHTIENWQDSGYWFALPCLLVALLFFRRGMLLCLLPLCLLVNPESSRAAETGAVDNAGAHWQIPRSWQDWWQTTDQQAAKKLQTGDAAAAAAQFSDPQWKAYAEYQSGQPKQAAEHFASHDSASANYNRGNALAQSGDLQGAISAYEKALQQNPKLSDASYNRDLVKKLLEQQKKQQQDKQQQQQQKQQDQQQQQNKQQQDQQQQDQQQQDQQQQDQQQGQQPDQQQQDQQNQQQQQGQQSDQQQNQSGSSQQQQNSAEQKQKADQSNREQAGNEQQAEQAQKEQQEKAEQAKAEEQKAQQEQEAREQEKADQQDNGQKEAENAGMLETTGDSKHRAEQEKQQATEQLLRKVPDDPGGLLKNKFEYYFQLQRQEEYRRRRAGNEQQEEQRW